MSNYPYVSAEEAVKLVKSGDRVFLHGSAATPVHTIKAAIHLKQMPLLKTTENEN